MEKIKVELHDKLSYMMKRKFYDGTIRAFFKFSGPLDKNIFSQALKYMIDEIPILHSSFKYNFINPYWQVKEYDITDILSFEESSNPEELANIYMLDTLTEDSISRVKAKVIYNTKISILLILIDHQCVDGIDFKYFLKTLIKKYNSLINKKEEVIVKKGPRNINQIYHDFSTIDKIKAKNLITYKKPNNHLCFPWYPKTKDDSNLIVRVKMNSNDFSIMKKKLQEKNATVTDALLSTLISFMYEKLDNNELFSVASVVDLRRHLKEPDLLTGLTNYSSLMGVTVNKNEDINEVLNEVATITKKEKANKFLGLTGLPLLKLGFKYLPFFIGVPIVEKNYVDAKLSLSNLGNLEKEDYELINTELKDFFIAGSIKYKPYFLISASTFNNELSLSVGIKGNSKDKDLVEEFLNRMIDNLKKIQ